MNTRSILFASGVIILAAAGCNSGSSTKSDTFSDSLMLGTGMNGFNITGETTTFTSDALIYWRLESKDDMGGSTVEIQISKSGSSGFEQVNVIPYTNPQNYGHIMLSSFKHTYGPGSFRATGKLVTGGKTVAYKNYTVQ